MPRLFLLSTLLAIPLVLGACAIPTSRSNIVVLTDSKAVVEPCRQIGEIDGASELHSILVLDKARDATLARLKIRAADMGGTHVLTPVADIKWKGPSTKGIVYKCGA
ncbi:hypothetical protein ASE63_14750 [Bosea sp. Root381]|uniref:hypothetical protein n=1 Tax=Bosea sp. Root381 TaxID=1736524 RepID=UPI0006F90938|nr:hypothetical protein [Bosea sp. Root381]KRE16963.1 hypothetical protein ASE63_14750 [Bosea sp. Root381]